MAEPRDTRCEGCEAEKPDLSGRARATLVVGPGPRAIEAALLAEVERHAREVEADAGRLARPLRIVVPSRAMRAHVAARIVAAARRPRLGLVVQTLHGLTLELLARAGRSLRDGHLLFPIVVRRLAQGEPALREALEPLQDGYAVAAQSVADLLDAGVLPAHLEGLEERLAEEVGPAEAARGAALLRVAVATSRALAAAGLVHRSALFREAAEVAQERPGVLPTARLLVVGYADATGVQADLLEALLRAWGGAALLDEPPDPAAPERPAPGRAFADRLRARLEGWATRWERAPAAPVSTLHAFAAPGAQVEAREVAERVAELVDAGVEPARIGIVARDPEEIADPLAIHLTRLGIPFLAGEGVPARLGPKGRAAHALGDLLGLGAEAPADRLLDAWAGAGPLRERDLRLALHALGAARVRHVATLAVEELAFQEGGLPLAVRRGIREDEAAPGEDPPEAAVGEDGAARSARPEAPRRAPRRYLAREALEEVRAAARGWLEGLEAWPAPAPAAAHAAHLRRLLENVLGWGPRTPGAAPLFDRVERLAQEAGPFLPLDREEFRLLLERRTRDLGREPRGRAAGGVQVRSVMEARGLTFEHLFVPGLNRDRFPRPAVQDPLLRDAARRRLEDLLPDVPVKARAFDEERYLFASLCAAAPHVVLSWQVVSDDGRERPPSPLVERLRLEEALGPVETVPGLFADGRTRPRPAFEHAVRAALLGAPEVARRALAATLDVPEAEAVAAARLRTVSELEGRARGLGPFLGLVGPGAAFRGDPWVTHLEALARCPWRAFLARVLRLEPLPDARSELPGLDPALVGEVVHGVLERIVRRAGAPGGAALDPQAPVHEVPWPSAEVLEAILAEVASLAVRTRGAAFPGFARAVAARARPLLERVREVEWASGMRRGVLGAELRGVARVECEDGPRRLRFRADRVDREEGVLRLVDYKTGRLPARGDPAAWWRGEVARGLWLQGVAYAHTEGAEARGGYVFCRSDSSEGAASTLETGREDEALAEVFAEATATLFAAAERGVLVPRLVDGDGNIPRDCTDFCEMRDACLQHDASARWRVRRLHLEPPEEDAPAERLARRLLAMGPAR